MPDRAAVREALAYLLDEIEMLRVPLARLPESLQTEAPLDGALSLRETYAVLAARDEARAAALIAGTAWPVADTVPAGAAEQPSQRLLDRVATARTALLDVVDALQEEQWSSAAPHLHRAVLDDAALMRNLAERLHDARGLGGV